MTHPIRPRSTLVLSLLLASGASASELERLDADASFGLTPPSGIKTDQRGRAYIASESGSSLYLGGHAQFRYTANWRSGVGRHDRFTNGFHSRRVRLHFFGTLIDPKLSYRIDAESSITGGFSLPEAFGRYQFNERFSIQWGQFKLPFLREETISNTNQLATERSPTNEAFSQARSQAIALEYRLDDVKLLAALSDGMATQNTDFTSPREADYALTGRVELKWAGEWKHFDQFTSFRGSPYAGGIGAALHVQQGGDTGITTRDIDLFTYTIDVMTKGDGWHTYGAFVGRHIDDRTVPGDFTDFGFIVQGGFFLSENTEAFARFDAIFPDNARALGGDFRTITFGAVYYHFPKSHALKVTIDCVVFLDDQRGSSSVVRPATGGALLTTPRSGQTALRAQAQIVF